MKNKNKLIGIAAVAVVIIAAVAVVLALVLGGSKSKAASMWLVRAEGTVAVTDGEGADVPLRNLAGVDMRLGLYDGYSVGTQYASYGWINLDDVKLTKLDEDSEVEIKKSGKKLELDLSRGSIFFNVTKPLEDDETLEIRSSTMVMAIRGTSGWVTAYGETMDVYIIEGEVKCTARVQGNLTPATESVKAGERARMSITGGEARISVEKYDISDVPEFVAEEARSDEKIAGDFAGIGMDFSAPAGPGDITPPPDNGGDTGSNGPGYGNAGGSGSLGYGNAGGSGEPDDEELAGTDPNSADYVTWEKKRADLELQHNWDVAEYSYPLFSGRAEGLDAINAFFKKLCQDFIDQITMFDASIDNDDIQYTEYLNLEDRRMYVEGSILSVIFEHCKYDSDGNDSMETLAYVFDLDTGERLKLTDLVEGTEDEIRTSLANRLRWSESYLDDVTIDYSKIETLDLDSVNFALSDREFNHTIAYFGDGVDVYLNPKDLGIAENLSGKSVMLPTSWPVDLAIKEFPDLSHETVTGALDPSTGYIGENGLLAFSTRLQFTGTAPGLERINAAFEQIGNDYVNSPEYMGVVERGRSDPQGTYHYIVSISEVGGYNDEFVSAEVYIEHLEEPSVGEPIDEMSFSGYTFNSKTGEQMKLTDFVGGSDSAILKFIADYLISEEYVSEEYRDRIMALDPDDLRFYVECGYYNGRNEVSVEVVFDLDDIGHESYLPQYEDTLCDCVIINMRGSVFC